MTSLNEMLSPESLWERLRNPLSGWCRVALALILPFVIWSHSPLLIVLIVLALASHPFWFPPLKGEGTGDIMTRAIDGSREWLRTAGLYEKSMVYYAASVLFASSLILLWERHWMGAILYICTLGFKLMAISWILEKVEQQDYFEVESGIETSAPEPEAPARPAPPRRRTSVFGDDD
jgi:hypothetical protein